MAENDGLGNPEERLRRYGRQPVDPGLQGRHLSAMAAASAGAPRRPGQWWARSRFATGLVAGFLLGGSGLAYAASQGALPDPVQDAVHAATSPVGIDVPKGNEDHGVERSTEGCGGETFKNHGQFVKQADDKAAAAKSDCGKPVPSTLFDASGAGDDCTGPPPWAHHRLTGTAKTQAQAAREAKCGEDDDEVTGTATPTAPSPAVQGEDDHGNGQSGEDHGQAGDDHGQAGVNGNGATNGRAGDDQGQSGDDHGKAGEDHGKAAATDTARPDTQDKTKPEGDDGPEVAHEATSTARPETHDDGAGVQSDGSNRSDGGAAHEGSGS